MNEQERQLIELVLQTNRPLLSSRTGFICSDECIPTYDNFLFCLALFRTRLSDNVLEAKKLLDRLLHFQSQGNYPVLLSDYPTCHDHLQALHILYVKLSIQGEFATVLGNGLSQRLVEAISLSQRFLRSVAKEVKFPAWAKIKMVACFEDEAVEVSDQSDMRTWGDPAALAQILMAYQLRPTANWQPFWNYLANTWHRPSMAFIGPAFKLAEQNRHLGAAMGLFCGKLPHYDRYPLTLALLQTKHELQEVPLPTTFSGTSDRFSWQVNQEPEYAYATITGRQNLELMPGFFPVHLVAGAHSLAIQAPQGYSPEPFVFELPESVFTDDKEKAKALVISFNDHKDNDVLVEGQKATCFALSDRLQIQLGQKRLLVQFSITSGDGTFVGHISRANRSGVVHDRFTANDVQIQIRALRATIACRLKINLILETAVGAGQKAQSFEP